MEGNSRSILSLLFSFILSMNNFVSYILFSNQMQGVNDNVQSDCTCDFEILCHSFQDRRAWYNFYESCFRLSPKFQS